MKKKGFTTILVSVSIFLIAILLLGTSTTESVSYKEHFSDAKVFLSNYELLLLQATQDCNWEKTPVEIGNCINNYSGEIIDNIKIPYTECFSNDFEVDPTKVSAKTILSCITEIDSEKEYFKNSFKKEILLEKME